MRVELRVLGRIDLAVEGDGRGAESVLSQPKRLAFLTYLATGHQASHRRDELIGVFWPELPDRRARRALSQSLYVLKDALGPDIVRVWHHEDVVVDRDVLWCDVVAFCQALDDGQLEDALGLYRGDLLEHFYLQDCPAFAEWLEQRRRSLRERAAGATRARSVESEVAGELRDALVWAERAATFAPYDEVVLRRLMSLHARLGERSSAIDRYERFADRLRGDLDLPVSPATQEVVAQIREGAPSAEDIATAEPGPAAVSISDAIDSSRAEPLPTQGARSPHRRFRIAASSAVGAVALTIAAYVVTPKVFPGTRALSANTYAVMPFAVRGESDAEFLREGMVDLLSAKLNVADAVQSVDPRVVLADERASAAAADPAAAAAVGRRFRAGRILMGSVIAAGQRLQLDVTAFDVEDMDTPIGRATVEGTSSALLDLVDRLAGEVLAQTVEPDLRFISVASVTSDSYDAVRSFLKGEELSRAAWRQPRPDRFAAPIEAYRSAIEADSSFALAHYRLAFHAWGHRDLDLARRSAAAALRHADRLPRHYQTLARGLAALFIGDQPAAERAYRTVTESRPHEHEAWFGLARSLIHYWWRRTVPADSLRAVLRTAAELRPGPDAHLFWAMVEAAEGNWDTVDSLVRNVYPDSLGVHWTALRHFDGESPHRAAALQRLRAAPPFNSLAGAYWLASFTGDMSAAIELVGTTISDSASIEQGWEISHLIQLSTLHAAAGQPHRAVLQLEVSMRRGDGLARLLAGMFLLNPAVRSVSPDELRRALAWVTEPRPQDMQWLDQLLGRAQEGGEAILPEYVAGILEARLGDTPSARQRATQLPSLASSDEYRLLAEDLASGIRAEIALVSGDTTVAIQLLESLNMVAPLSRVGSPFFTRAHQRILRAELYFARGEFEKAKRDYDTFRPYDAALELTYYPLVHLRRAQIHDRLGERVEAIELYERFLRMWQDPEPKLRPIVADARARVAALVR